jgi:hypothetical protein
MLKITIGGDEFFDEEKQEFFTQNEMVLELEHSLVSLSKWESKFQKPFLAEDEKSVEELLWYVKFMILTPNYPENFWEHLSQENVDEINAYIESKQSATTFGDLPSTSHRSRGERITSELIYYWMVVFNIPFETETWHLNRLFSLIRICNLKQQKPKKMSRQEIAQRNRELNAQRRAALGTSG